MAKRIDITGQKFNMLKVLSWDKDGWTFLCDCGNLYKTKRSYNVRVGDKKSCGCSDKKVLDLKNRNKEINKIYNGCKILNVDVKNLQAYATAECFCGNVFQTYLDLIQSGHTKSCSCISRRLQTEKAEIERKNEIQKIHNGLLILDVNIIPNPDKKYPNRTIAIAKFLCFCGKIGETQLTFIKCGKIKSCGCLVKLDFGIAIRNGILNSIKHGAISRNLEFKLKNEQIINLILSNCFYCKVPPSSKKSNKNEYFISNGIDRIKNNLGYTEENCVPACFICNRGKLTDTPEDFQAWINRVKNKNEYIFEELKEKEIPWKLNSAFGAVYKVITKAKNSNSNIPKNFFMQ